MSSPIRSSKSLDVDALLAALPRRIADVPAHRAAESPAQPALIEDARRLSYGDLAQAVDAAAARLATLGVQGGDRVMIVAENCVAQIVLLFAAARLDAWALVSNARLSAAELDAIAAHARPKLIAFTTDVSPDARAHAERLGATPAAALPVDIGAWSYHVDASAPAEPVATGSAAQCAALIYTTGTTGTPKGVMLSHRNLLFIAATSSMLRRVSPDDVVYTVLPVSHVYGLASVCLGSLYAGATLRLAPRFSPEAVRVALADEGVTIFQGVPAMHAKLLEHLHTHGHAWRAPRLRFAYSGGSPLDANLKARVEHVYGVPIPGVDVRIVAPDGTDVPPGEVGEIRVRGPNVMLGYYRNADATRAAVSADGWLSTGDLARQEADGAVTIAGRSKELIIRSGFNVYPVEVEQVLNAHPDVVQAAVIGRAIDGNEEVLAFVELVPGAAADEAALHAWCADRLTAYKRPAHIRVLDALPAASTGKVLKHRLRELV